MQIIDAWVSIALSLLNPGTRWFTAFGLILLWGIVIGCSVLQFRTLAYTRRSVHGPVAVAIGYIAMAMLVGGGFSLLWGVLTAIIGSPGVFLKPVNGAEVVLIAFYVFLACALVGVTVVPFVDLVRRRDTLSADPEGDRERFRAAIGPWLKALKFIGMSCLVFLAIGPLLSFLGTHVAASMEGKPWDFDAGSLPGYLDGSWTALKIGLIFAAAAGGLALAVPRFAAWPALERSTLGGIVGGTASLIYVLSSLTFALTRRWEVTQSLQAWSRYDVSSLAAIFVFPGIVCGAIASLWLLPRLRLTDAPTAGTR